MKVLLYGKKDGFLEPIFYYGLVENLGKKNVITTWMNSEVKSKGDSVSQIEILDQIDNFDLFIAFDSVCDKPDLKKILNKYTSTKKIFVDGGDDFFIRAIYLNPNLDFYFKRELYYDFSHVKNKHLWVMEWSIRYSYEIFKRSIMKRATNELFSKLSWPIGIAAIKKYKKIKPFPLTVNPVKERSREKRVYDLTFVGTLNNPERKRYINYLISHKNETKINQLIITYHPGESKSLLEREYHQYLFESKAGLSLRGTGYDTFRYWEIPSHGAMLFSQKVPIVIPHNFQDGISAVYFNGFEELKKKIIKYLVKSNEWQEIAKNGYKHFMKFHTPKARLKKFLEIVK